MLEFITILLLALILVSWVFWLIALLLSYHFYSSPEPVRDGFLPPVSLLKPFTGVDSGAYENFASFCRQDYPDYEILFGTFSPDEPMVPVIDRIKRDFPELPIRILIAQPPGANQKAAMLHLLAEESRHPVIVTNDSDMRATPDYLRTIVQPLRDENIGLVTCCYRGNDARTLTARLEALHMGATFIPLVMVARKLLDMRFAMGATLALRRSDLECIGGFASLVEYLADDSMLALRISALRKRIHLSKYVIESVLGATVFREQWQREVRWACTNRLNRPAEYPFQLIYFSTPLSLIYLVVSQFSTTGYALLVISLLLRWMVGRLTGIWTENHEMLRWLYLLPLRDCFSMVVWVVGGLSNTVIWRGIRLRLYEDGRMEVSRPTVNTEDQEILDSPDIPTTSQK